MARAVFQCLRALVGLVIGRFVRIPLSGNGWSKATRYAVVPAIFLTLALWPAGPARANTYYWDNNYKTPNVWGQASNWSASPNSIVTGAVPGGTDTAVFSITTLTGSANLWATMGSGASNRGAEGLVFTSTGAFTLRSSTGNNNNTLAIGDGGIMSIRARAVWTQNGTGKNADGSSPNGGATTGTLSISLTADQSWTIDNAAGMICRAPISGSYNLTIPGTGVLTLAASNSYTGTTYLNGGILSLGNSAALAGTAGITFGGGTLQFSAGSTPDYSAKIVNSSTAISVDPNGQSVTFGGALSSSNNGGLTLTGTNGGTLILAGNNAYSGPTAVNNGTLNLSSGSLTGGGAITVASGATFTQGSAAMHRAAAPRSHRSGATTLAGNNTYSGPTAVNAGTLVLSGSAAGWSIPP